MAGVSVVQAPARVQVGNADSTTITFDHDVTVGNYIAVAVFGTRAIASGGFLLPAGTITDNKSNTYTKIIEGGQAGSGSYDANAVVFYTKVGTGGPGLTITVDPTGASDNYFNVDVFELAGVHSDTNLGIGLSFGGTGSGTSASTGNLGNYAGPGDWQVSAVAWATPAGTPVQTAFPQNPWTMVDFEATTSFCPGAVSIRSIVTPDITGNTFTTANSGLSFCIATFRAASENAAFPLAKIASNWAVSDVDVQPSAVYDPAINKTIIPFEGSGVLQLAVYDHATGSITTTQISSGGVTDGHGVPAIVIGSDGKYHIMWGAHGSPVIYLKSTNANDPTAWTTMTTPEATALSYPNLFVFSDGSICVIYRNGFHGADWVYKVSSNQGSTWTSSPIHILESSTTNVWYQCMRQLGDDIYISWVWEDDFNSEGSPYAQEYNKYGIYFFKITNKMSAYSAIDGTALTPIMTKTDMDAHCVVRANAHYPLRDVEAQWDFDATNKPCLLLIRASSATAHVASFTRWNGSAWTSPVTITSDLDHVSDGGRLVYLGSGRWSCYLTRFGTTSGTGDANDTDLGGQIHEFRSEDDGLTWFFFRYVSQRARMNYPARVVNGISPIKYIAADWVGVLDQNGLVIYWDDARAEVQAPPSYHTYPGPKQRTNYDTFHPRG